jgi:SAM-dependent methyltransferase
MLQRQQEFNSTLVDHVNRTHARAAESREAVAALGDALSAQLAALARFQSRLIACLQQVTLYVDTKDRHEAGVLRYKMERETGGVAAGLDALGDELLKRWESAMARERRFDARVEELRARLAAFQKVSETPGAAEPPSALRPPPETGQADERHESSAPAGTRGDALAGDDQSPVYAGFEDVFRGPAEDIAARVSEYLPLFAGARDVLDIGCGRGEFLERLGAQGVTARGVDLNGEMVRRCRERGLDVVEADALEYLAALPDASLGGIFAAQVIEHLPPDRLLRLLSLAQRKLRPGGRVVLETINPACWAAFFDSYIRDITHVRPVHPETLRYLMTATGFSGVDIRFSAPYPRDGKLQRAPRSVLVDAPYLSDLVEAFDGNVETLNGLLFTYLDYAGVGEKA